VADCGCRDGWIYEGDSARACVCQRGRSAFKGSYHPAGRSRRQRFRELQRWRARRSAVVRRQLAKGKPPRRRERSRPLALARAYPKLSQLSRVEFAARYEATCAREGWTLDARGVNTAWELYVVLWRHYRVYGQDFEFTNGQIAVALSRAGRPRGRRAIQYTRKRLEAMGLFSFAWVKRGTWQKDRGWVPGERKDTIRATALHVRRSRANCTPPTGAEASGLRPSAIRSLDRKDSAELTATNSLGPPAAAENDGACGAERPDSTERATLEAQIRFQHAKLAAGWEPARTGAELRRLRQALRLLDAPGGPESSGHVSDRIASSTDAGLM
jgi:hypothetical protein